jgi:hypothetical protein
VTVTVLSDLRADGGALVACEGSARTRIAWSVDGGATITPVTHWTDARGVGLALLTPGSALAGASLTVTAEEHV